MVEDPFKAPPYPPGCTIESYETKCNLLTVSLSTVENGPKKESDKREELQEIRNKENSTKKQTFACLHGNFYRTQVYLGSDLWVRLSVTEGRL